MKQPPLRRRDQVRAWILIALGTLMILAGVLFAIHKFTPLDLAPLAGGIAAVLVGSRYLRRKEIF
ncbi:uncharacterized membrane protein HdeD (DUF308 family) [Deinococcus sp. UYEF24]